MVISVDPNLLLGYYQAKAGVSGAAGGSNNASGSAARKVAPTPPWIKADTPQQASAKVTAAIAGHKLVDENAAKLDLPGASADYKKLFSLYQGLGTLMDLATRAQAKGVSASELKQLQKAFASGLVEVQSYVGQAKFDKLRLIDGAVADSDKTTLVAPKAPTQYVTPPLTSSSSDSVAAFEGDVRFTISVERLNQTIDVPIDLSAMPDPTRSIGAVVIYINDQLAAAGLETRFGTQRIPGEAQQLKVGGKSVTLPAGPDHWALKVTQGTSETVSFGSDQTAGAVYMAQQIGQSDPNNDGKLEDSTLKYQLLKFQTDTVDLATPPQIAGQANFVDGRVFAQDLDPDIVAVRAQTVGPDGAVYMLADITGTVAGQSIRGDQDVALMKYDSAGKLIYARTLGASEKAAGMALAVSADGQVAVAGSVNGSLQGAVEGALNSGAAGTYAGQADSFVTLFDASGQELWTQRRGARQDDQVNQLAFGADGAVYVAGQSKSPLPGAGASGGDWDGYLEAFKADTAGKVQTLFTQAFGGSAAEKPRGLVVDGSALVVASNEDGHAVLRRFDLSSGEPVEVASRDLGDLQGGEIAGLALNAGGDLVVAGTTGNPALAVDTISRAASGGQDAFAARLAANLGSSATDRLAYYGGAGDDRARALAVAGGQVWIAGSAGGDLPGQDPVGAHDGFLASLDLDGGTIDWSRRFTGAGGEAAPSAIAANVSGASVLDRLGLPTGPLEFANSQQLTAISALRPGDQFTVQVGTLPAKTVTIDADETFDTLALKVQRASGFAAKVTLQSSADGRQLKIAPASASSIVTLGAGRGDADALSILGLPQGAVRTTITSKAGVKSAADGKPNLYGLGLDSRLNLSDASQVSHALNLVSAAQGVVRQVYKDLVAAATPKALQPHAAANAGKVPAYMKDQIANYQAALQRLTAGSTADSSQGLTIGSLLG